MQLHTWYNAANYCSQTLPIQHWTHCGSSRSSISTLRWWQIFQELRTVEVQQRAAIPSRTRKMREKFLAFSLDNRIDHPVEPKMIRIIHGAQFPEFFEKGFIYFPTDIELFKSSKSVIMRHRPPYLHSVWKYSTWNFIFQPDYFFWWKWILCVRRSERT